MSPEQARASARLDHQCDLWALATIAYEGLSGDLPVTGNDTDELLKNLCAGRIVPLLDRSPEMPPALDVFFRRAFSEAIGVRFPSATELAVAFARAAATASDRHAATDPPGAVPPLPSVVSVRADVEPARRRRGLRVAVIATGLSLLALLGVAIAWHALAPAPSEGAVTALPPPKPIETAPSVPALSTSPPPSAAPPPAAVAFSALPRPQGRPAATAPPSASPTPISTPSPTPAPVPTPPPKKLDKSEVL